MVSRGGFSLLEVVVAAILLVASVLTAAQAAATLRRVSASAARWRRSAVEVEVLIGRFERAPCALMPTSPGEIVVGGVTWRWEVADDSGSLSAVRWPIDAPSPVRRGALCGVLACE